MANVVDPRLAALLRPMEVGNYPLGTLHPPDPRTLAIERYMQEQGDQSRLPVYNPNDLKPRGIEPSIPSDPEVPLSPNELQDWHDEQADQGQMIDDFIAELADKMKAAKDPYYGSESLRRRFFPKRTLDPQDQAEQDQE